MERTPVTSSNVVSIGYDASSQEMDVEFKGGKVYRYSGVPAEKHAAVMAGPSVGSNLHSIIIKGGYACRQIA